MQGEIVEEIHAHRAAISVSILEEIIRGGRSLPDNSYLQAYACS